ncbi:MAG: hypothetical protein HY329_27380 [Chloroflexi bacterium]|nr:hypothetical protein [Chloroflexota bacterium]
MDFSYTNTELGFGLTALACQVAVLVIYRLIGPQVEVRPILYALQVATVAAGAVYIGLVYRRWRRHLHALRTGSVEREQRLAEIDNELSRLLDEQRRS